MPTTMCLRLEYRVPRGRRWLEQYADNLGGREQADAQRAWLDKRGIPSVLTHAPFVPPAIQSFPLRRTS